MPASPSCPPAPGDGLSRQALARRTAALLAAHVPLSLLLDLADPRGPRSEELLRQEAHRG